MEMAQIIPVVKIDDAKEQAYDTGYDKFSEVPVDDPETFDLEGFRDSADYANNVLPSLRALAGHEDGVYGTWTGDRDVAILEAHQEDDVPAKCVVTMASDLLDELLEAWERGAYDAANGEERYATLDF